MFSADKGDDVAVAKAKHALKSDSRAVDRMRDAETRLVSVVVVNYNAGSLLTPCITGTILQGVGEVTVVDNASSDGSLLALQKALSGQRALRVIASNQNIGFAAACNVGIRASSGRYFLLLNPDARIEEGALERMLEALTSAPEVGMVGSFLCNTDGTEQAGGRRVLPTPRRAFVRAFGLAPLRRIWPKMFSDFLLHKEPLPHDPVVVEAISGACMLVRREALEDVGLLDEGYFLHCEDLDWCVRFKRKGWKTLFVPGARVTHFKGTCSSSRPIFVEWHKHKGMVRFYSKFFRHTYPGIMMALVTAAVWMRFLFVCVFHIVRPDWWRLAWPALRGDGTLSARSIAGGTPASCADYDGAVDRMRSSR